MKNCFIKKLKGSYDGLTDKVGELTLVVKSNPEATSVYNKQFVIRGYSTHTIYCDDSSKFFEVDNQRVNTYTFNNATKVITVDNEDYVIRVTNKYAISSLGGAEEYRTIVYFRDINALKENTVFVNITCNPFEDNLPVGDVSVLNYARLISGNLKYAELEGSIDDLTELGTDLTYFKIKGKNINGNISVFSDCINLAGSNFEILGTTHLEGEIQSLSNLTRLYRCNFIANNSGIKGNIDAYVLGNCNAATNPRTSWGEHDSGVYFGGDILSKCAFNGNTHASLGHDFIGWDSSSKIYVLTGPTYNNRTKVYCKGYTQVEAETLFPNKEIVMV